MVSRLLYGQVAVFLGCEFSGDGAKDSHRMLVLADVGIDQIDAARYSSVTGGNMITIMHMPYDLDKDRRFSLVTPYRYEAERARLALELLQEGVYEAVARVDTQNLDEAYMLTQNGGQSESWSRFPPKKVQPLGQGYVEMNGRKLGYKSSEVGDVFIREGEAFVVAVFGFEKIKGWTPTPDLESLNYGPRSAMR